VGAASYLIAPLVIASMLLLANFRIRTIDAENYQIQTYVLFLQLSLGTLFAICYALAIWFRKQADVHARFIVCTALTLIDPIFARLYFTFHPEGLAYQQWVTYGLTDIVFLVLIWFERGNTRARWVFPVMLAVFVLFQVPALFWWTEWPLWRAFARWFSSVPLT
jgi:hypothetical protein